MSNEAGTEPDQAPTGDGSGTTAPASPSSERTIVPQFALDAADAQIATWSAAIVEGADSIDRLIKSESLPVPDAVRDLATATADKLRKFGTASGETEAAELVAGLQRTAAAHPAASIGLGAAIGAALATILVRLAPSASSPQGSGGGAKTTGSTTKPAKS